MTHCLALRLIIVEAFSTVLSRDLTVRRGSENPRARTNHLPITKPNSGPSEHANRRRRRRINRNRHLAHGCRPQTHAPYHSRINYERLDIRRRQFLSAISELRTLFCYYGELLFHVQFLVLSSTIILSAGCCRDNRVQRVAPRELHQLSSPLYHPVLCNM